MLNNVEAGEGFVPGLWPLLDGGNRNFLGASIHVYNSMGESIMNPPGGGPGIGQNALYPYEDAEVSKMIEGDLSAILSGNEVSAVERSADGSSFLVVGVPIRVGDSVTGAVLFTKPMSELTDTQNGLNLTLAVSTLTAFLIMLVPGYLAARRLIVPIRQMGDIARAMAKGDFSQRADEGQKGEIGELGRAMNHFAEESGKLEQTRRDYVANVSHELRTPIAAIRAMGETLRDGMAKTPEKQAMFHNNIVRESMRLSRLVDDLLELSRLQSGREAMQKNAFDLNEAVRNAAEVYSHLAADAGVSLVLPEDMEGAVPVFGSPDRIEQVLVAFLDNAIKHTPKAGEISLQVMDAADHVVACVANTGEGIPSGDLPYIFDRFYKADKAHSSGGSGLGLSIAKEILDLLGEDIWAESGNGLTRFCFTVHKSV
jgi:signal transduction histidine kinase